MKNDNLNLMEIKSRSNFPYLYDPSSNLVFPDQSGFLFIVKNFHSMTKEEIISTLTEKYEPETVSRIYDYILTLKSNFNAFQYSEKNNRGIHMFEDEGEYNRSLANINQMVLELTQSCNLRCKYCLYSGEIPDFRPHNTSIMDFEVAKASIDYYFNLLRSPLRTKKYGRVFINLYGGEPLLNFGLLKKIVEYVKNQKLKESPLKEHLHFTITTNGLLLTDEIVTYLVENEILLAVSLDGPEKEHDKNRVLSNGEGSFRKIWKNLTKLKKNHKRFFESSVVFLLTLNPNHDVVAIGEFFQKFLGERHDRLKVSMLRSENFLSYSDLKESFSELRNQYYSAVLSEELFMPLLKSLFNPFYKLVYEKKFMNKINNFTAACNPSEFRFFVSIKGDYHICERINPNFSIGNYKTGLQYEKVKQVYEKFNEQFVKNRCYMCPARQFCTICFAGVSQGKGFTDYDRCQEQIRLTKGILQDVISIYEKKEDAFKVSPVPAPKNSGSDRLLSEAFY